MKKIICLAMGAFFAFSTMYVEGMPGDNESFSSENALQGNEDNADNGQRTKNRKGDRSHKQKGHYKQNKKTRGEDNVRD